MKKMKLLLLLAIGMVLTACSEGKKSGSASGNQITAQQVAGYYLGVEEYANWSCNVCEDGTGYEMAGYSNNSIKVIAPFRWTVKDGEITFTFDTDEITVEAEPESEMEEAIVTSALQGYSEPRVCKLKSEGKVITINGDGLYPTYTNE